jgi:hypothetical protein
LGVALSSICMCLEKLNVLCSSIHTTVHIKCHQKSHRDAPRAMSSMEYLTYCYHMGVSGNRFATHDRGVNVRGIN